MTKAQISEYMSTLGRMNKGRKLTPEKLAAVRANLALARQRLAALPEPERKKIMRARARARRRNKLQRNGK